jgi:hypothetical protein
MFKWFFLQVAAILILSCVHTETFAQDVVYLVSFPRSGNHWVRFLVEEASHIATSSIYRDSDYPHLSKIFPWGGYSTDHGYSGTCQYPTELQSVLVKTHYPFLPALLEQKTRRTICLIRHPVDAFYSFYVYRQKKYGNLGSFCEFLRLMVKKWKDFYEFWETQENVLMIRYEDLYENPEFYLKEILDVLGYNIQQSDIERAVDLFPPQGGVMKHKVQYRKEDIKLIKSELNDLLVRFNYSL